MTAWQMHKESHGILAANNCYYCNSIVPPIDGKLIQVMGKSERSHIRGLWTHAEKLLLQRTNFDFYREIMDKKKHAHKARAATEAVRRKLSFEKKTGK